MASEAGTQGFEQFGLASGAPGLDYCISGAEPYLLDSINRNDVICLLLGDIASEARYDDEQLAAHTFKGETLAFHPKGSRMWINALEVRQRFIAFRCQDTLLEPMCERGAAALRRNGNVDNIAAAAIQHLVRYARRKVAGTGRLDPWEAQCVGTLACLETVRALERPAPRKIALSDTQFARMEEFIAANLAENLTCPQIAGALDLPVRAVVDGVKGRTGYSLYRFVVDKRVEAAATLLRDTDLPISDIAFGCGFSSQQHMTSVFAERLGVTPMRLRKGAGSRPSA
ncbi:helix-turn-helix domain-containing protein [Paraburkholderia acidipaludis]|uniref:helix-turn-helix domain-containing protein n=1 Tax=Paraburkholderia acidipaludis TaxID=660537 RepID=UPI00048707B0|nr:AraC family transcriptional regulator [Paraburkholderia acidipaludis]